MRLTRSRLVAVVAFTWLLASLAGAAAVSPDRLEAGPPGEGTRAAATLLSGPAGSTRRVDSAWLARWQHDCSAPWVPPSDPFAFFAGGFGEPLVTVATALLPALTCGLEAGA